MVNDLIFMEHPEHEKCVCVLKDFADDISFHAKFQGEHIGSDQILCDFATIS